jgi:muconate cycloisomerase
LDAAGPGNQDDSMKPAITVTAVEALLVDLPTIRAHKLAMTVMHQQTLVIVRLRCSDGHEGVGEATSIGGLAYGDQSPEGVKLAIDTYLTPLLIGLDATNVNAAMALLARSIQGQSFAKSAIETALLDAEGRRRGLPVHALLGGAVRAALPVLWTLASGDSARDIDEALALIEQRRHKVFKLKVGRRDVAADVAHVAAIKRALGDEVLITVDANQAWDEAEATRAVAVSRRHRGALARLSARFDVPIMADEGFNDAIDAFELARNAAADVFALKLSKAGGPGETLRAAAVADAAGIGLYGGTLLEGSLGSVAAAHTFATCPQLAWGTELFGPLLLKDDIVVERPVFRDFELHLPTGPGLGLQIDEDKLAHYRRDRPRTSIRVTAPSTEV